MARCFVLISFIFVACNQVMAQTSTVLVFDLLSNELDSINNIEFNDAVHRENTQHSVGKFNQLTEFLEEGIPVTNLFPGSQFTQKRRASADYDLNSYPLSTSVKIFSSLNNSLQDLCSGSMISKRHVLTAAHCVSSLNTDQLLFNMMYVAPVYDNDEFNSSFQGSFVRKVYIFKNWSLNGEDMAILELEETIGELTGWISVGFESEDEVLKEGVFYKFSYPNFTNPIIDTNEYNGGTLYYNYGLIDDVDQNRISITKATGVGGESGSSIIKVENGERYITYGVLSVANNLSHSRINKWRYFAIKTIVNDDIVSNDVLSKNQFIVFPNPTTHGVRILKPIETEILDVILYDSMGRKCELIELGNSFQMLDLSRLSNGVYFLKIRTNWGTVSKKIIKNHF